MARGFWNAPGVGFAEKSRFEWLVYTKRIGAGFWGIEVSPPVSGYNLGRAVIGNTADSSVTDFIDRQGIQNRIVCDTSWLLVGHIDEVITFVPYGGGFKVLVADTDLAISLLQQLDVNDTGAASSADTISITDASKSWAGGEWTGGFIEITAGVGSGQVRQIAGNTSNTVTVSRPWATVPDDSSQYELVARSAYRAMFFEGDEDCGVATEENSSSLILVDNTKNWPPGHWIDGYVLIVEGAAAGEVKQITSSDSTSIMVSEPFTIKPNETSRYVVVQGSKMWNEQKVLQPEAIITVMQVLQGQLGILDISEDVSDEINSIRNALKNGLGLSDNDFVEIPALFWDGDQYISGDQIVANIPSMVNMLVVGNRAIIAKPFGPLDNGTNIFEDYVNSELGTIGISVDFVDDWDTYHRNDGEIHCGTKVKRTPLNTNWWE
jgi:protein-arginine deiminase